MFGSPALDRDGRGDLAGPCGIALTPAVIAKDRHDDAHWVGTWSASPQAVAAPIQINGQTVRQIVHTSLGGERVRVRLSNAYGTSGTGHRLRARGHQRRRRIDFQPGPIGCSSSMDHPPSPFPPVRWR